MELSRAIVVGGGLAGLTAANALNAAGFDVSVLEAARWGGQVRTRRDGPFLVEEGAEGFSTSGREVLALCNELGLSDRLLSQTEQRTLGYDGVTLRDLPPGRAAELAGIQADPEAFGAGLMTLRGGLGELVEALVARLSTTARLMPNVAVERLRAAGEGWIVEARGAGELTADVLVLAVPARDLAGLLTPLLRVPPGMASLPHRTSVTVTHGYLRSTVRHELDAAGFVVMIPPEESELRACTFSSSKYAGRSPPEMCLLRTFFRPRSAEGHGKPDAEWSRVADAALQMILGLEGRPVGRWVSRWPAALPRYPDDHGNTIARLREAIARAGLPPLEIAGAAVWRGGVAGAVTTGDEAARRLASAR